MFKDSKWFLVIIWCWIIAGFSITAFFVWCVSNEAQQKGLI